MLGDRQQVDTEAYFTRFITKFKILNYKQNFTVHTFQHTNTTRTRRYSTHALSR